MLWDTNGTFCNTYNGMHFHLYLRCFFFSINRYTPDWEKSQGSGLKLLHQIWCENCTQSYILEHIQVVFSLAPSLPFSFAVVKIHTTAPLFKCECCKIHIKKKSGYEFQSAFILFNAKQGIRNWVPAISYMHGMETWASFWVIGVTFYTSRRSSITPELSLSPFSSTVSGLCKLYIFNVWRNKICLCDFFTWDVVSARKKMMAAVTHLVMMGYFAKANKYIETRGGPWNG